ncbi:hypothetical protein [Streptomyces acidiscabies]|uniref:hypothetical protein n=1 Tax=Streptomyces acidiscabies TaxID=42234 RepID=UPI000B21EBF0|nr:hypothetical protein [Streptomyces acidiscabies]
MNDPGPPPSPKNPGDGFPAAPAAYHGVGLVPSAGPARTWGLAVVGVPLVLVLILTLAGSLSGGSDDNSARSGSTWSGSSGWPGTSETASPADTSAGSWGWSGASESETATAPAYEESATPSASASAYVESATPTPTPSPSPSGPEAVVTAYFAAINNGDYSTAWSLGGKNLDPDYDAFVGGFATTQSDTITITSVQGADVHLTLVARQTDGTTKTYAKVYTVSGGEIVKSSGNQIS